MRNNGQTLAREIEALERHLGIGDGPSRQERRAKSKKAASKREAASKRTSKREATSKRAISKRAATSKRALLAAEIEDFQKKLGIFESEYAKGVEDEITQDSLDSVEEIVDGDKSTDDSVSSVASDGYVARLKKASGRLDRVAAYFEEQGSRKMAYRIDKVADAIDSRIKEVQDEQR